MVHVALTLLMAITTGDGKTLEYEAALAKAQEENKPLVIMIGAPWCASCQIMKRDTMEPMMRSGRLSRVVVTYIDKDQRPELCGQLMNGETLPQVIMFAKQSGGWKRFSLTGMQSEGRMAELLGRANAVVGRLR